MENLNCKNRHKKYNIVTYLMKEKYSFYAMIMKYGG